MKSKTKNLKILALILLTSTLLIIGSGAASVKAATEPTVYVYNSQGGDIAANGTQLTPSTNYNYTDGDTVNFTPVPGTGFAFLCWDWLGTATPVTSTSNTLTETLSASDACAIQALSSRSVTLPKLQQEADQPASLLYYQQVEQRLHQEEPDQPNTQTTPSAHILASQQLRVPTSNSYTG